MSDNENEIFRALGQIEGKLDGFLMMQNQHTDDIESLQTVVSRLLTKQSYMLGVAAGVSGVVTLIIQYLFN